MPPQTATRWNLDEYRAHLAATAGAKSMQESRRARAQPEYDAQVRFFAGVDILAELYPAHAADLEDVYATANGGKRHRGEAGKLRAAGVRRGVPDIEAWIPVAPYHGLVIELKAPRSGQATKEQKARIARLRKRGYRAEICHGWQRATAVLCEYLGVAVPPDFEQRIEARLHLRHAMRRWARRQRKMASG